MRFLTHPLHMRVNGKPLIVVSRPELLDSAKETLSGWRRLSQAAGLPDLYLCGLQSSLDTNVEKAGFDALIEAPWRVRPTGVLKQTIEDLPASFSGQVYDYATVARQALAQTTASNRLLRAICPGFDDTALKGDQATIFSGATPKLYEYWLRGLIEYTQIHRENDERLVFIHAWNDWGRGAYLEPDMQHRRDYIDATRRALANRTSPETLFQMILDRIDQLGSTDLHDQLREETLALLREQRGLSVAERYFATEKIINDRLTVERSCAVFEAADIDALIGPEAPSPIKFSLEEINNRGIKNAQMVDAAITNLIRGWIVAEGIFPESLTTLRLLLLKRISTGEIYAARIPGTQERNDVAKHFAAIDKKYTQFSGFLNVFSFANVPGDAYLVGFAAKSDYKKCLGWSNFVLRIIN